MLAGDVAIVYIAVGSQSVLGPGFGVRALNIGDVHDVTHRLRGGLAAANAANVVNKLLIADEFGSLWWDISELLHLVDWVERAGGGPN